MSVGGLLGRYRQDWLVRATDINDTAAKKWHKMVLIMGKALKKASNQMKEYEDHLYDTGLGGLVPRSTRQAGKSEVIQIQASLYPSPQPPTNCCSVENYHAGAGI